MLYIHFFFPLLLKCPIFLVKYLQVCTESCYGKNSVKIIINPESLTGLRDLFCALLYAIILTSCSFSDK